jgi:hypothetical protein
MQLNQAQTAQIGTALAALGPSLAALAESGLDVQVDIRIATGAVPGGLSAPGDDAPPEACAESVVGSGDVAAQGEPGVPPPPPAAQPVKRPPLIRQLLAEVVQATRITQPDQAQDDQAIIDQAIAYVEHEDHGGGLYPDALDKLVAGLISKWSRQGTVLWGVTRDLVRLTAKSARARKAFGQLLDVAPDAEQAIQYLIDQSCDLAVAEGRRKLRLNIAEGITSWRVATWRAEE